MFSQYSYLYNQSNQVLIFENSCRSLCDIKRDLFNLLSLVLNIRPDVEVLGRFEIGVSELILDCHWVRSFEVHD